MLAACVGSNDLFSRHQLNSFLLVNAGDMTSQVAREEAFANVVTWKNQCDFLLIHSEGRGDFAPDEPAANDSEALALLAQRAQAPVIGEGAKIDNFIIGERKTTRRAAGGQEKFS